MAKDQTQSARLSLRDYVTRIWKLILVSIKDWKGLKAYLRLSPVKTSLMLANMKIGKLSPQDWNYHSPSMMWAWTAARSVVFMLIVSTVM